MLDKSFHRKVQSRKIFTHRESFETIIAKTEEKLSKVSLINKKALSPQGFEVPKVILPNRPLRCLKTLFKQKISHTQCGPVQLPVKCSVHCACANLPFSVITHKLTTQPLWTFTPSLLLVAVAIAIAIAILSPSTVPCGLQAVPPGPPTESQPALAHRIHRRP